MKEIKTNIDLLINADHTRIVVRDKNSGLEIIDVELTPEQLSRVLSRECRVDCVSKVTNNFENIGKRYIGKQFSFEIGKPSYQFNDDSEIVKIGKEKCPDGWFVRNYYNSQNSFFEKDGKYYARTTIYKYVDENPELTSSE